MMNRTEYLASPLHHIVEKGTGAVLAYTFKEFGGEEALRMFLERGCNQLRQSREDLQSAVEELDKIGLEHVAKIAREYIDKAPKDEERFLGSDDNKWHLWAESPKLCYLPQMQLPR